MPGNPPLTASTLPPLHLCVQYAERASGQPGPGWMPSRAQVRRWVQATREALAAEQAAELTVRFASAREARALNTEHRQGDYVPNVLTFALHAPDADCVQADIVICMQVVRAQAREQRKSVPDHCAHMVVHGVLHASGHDHQHPAQAELMEALERFVLERFRIADPY